MRKTAMAILLGGLFLLMLSALVVTPGEALPPEPPPLPRQYHAVFMPPVDPPAPVSAGVPLQRVQPWLTEHAADAVIPDGRHMPEACDSNGRVLHSARYENSVHEVFRAEVAGG